MKVSVSELLAKRAALYDNYKTPAATHELDLYLKFKQSLNPQEWYEMQSNYQANGYSGVFLHVADKTEYRVTIVPITPVHTPVNH